MDSVTADNIQQQPASAPIDAVRDQAPPQTPSVADQPGQQQSEPQVDWQARAQELEQRAQAAERERQQTQAQVQQFQQTLSQLDQQNKAQAERQAFEQRRQQILAQARSMRVDEGERFIADQIDTLYNEFDQRAQRIRQEEQQRLQQTVRQVATPLFVQDIMQQTGLPREYEKRLMELAKRDPDLAAAEAPYLKQQYEEQKRLADQLQQLSRTNEARTQQQQGVNRLGGYVGAPELEVPENLSPDERAKYIFRQLRQARRQQ